MDDSSDFKSDILKLQEIETITNKLKEVNRKLKTIDLTELELKNHHDTIKFRVQKQKQDFEGKIANLKQDLCDMDLRHKEETQALEKAFMGQNKELEKVQASLNVHQWDNQNDTGIIGNNTALIEEILNDSIEFYAMPDNINLKLKEVTEENQVLNKQVLEYLKDTENLRNCLEEKRNKRIEINKKVEMLTDEITGLTAELNSLTSNSKPIQPNSLFAEVNNRRVDLQEKINNMASTYLSGTKEIRELEQTLHIARQQKMKLIEEWKSDILEIDEDQSDLIYSLSSMIDFFLIMKQKNYLLISVWEMAYADIREIDIFGSMLNDRKDVIKFLKEQVMEKDVALLFLNQELSRARNKKSKYQTTLTKLEMSKSKDVSELNEEGNNDVHNVVETIILEDSKNLQEYQSLTVHENVSIRQKSKSLRETNKIGVQKKGVRFAFTPKKEIN